jgi:uncharacterized RDD family membrane protein YckC
MSAQDHRLPSSFPLNYGEFHHRLGAYVIDAIVCFALSPVFVFVVARPIIRAMFVPEGTVPADPQTLWAGADPWQKAVVLMLFVGSFWIPSWLYYAVLESSSRRATLGKRALRMVTVQTNGSRVSFLRATARYFLKAIVIWLPFGFIFVLPVFGKRRQGVHDWATGIVVVRTGVQAVPAPAMGAA